MVDGIYKIMGGAGGWEIDIQKRSFGYVMEYPAGMNMNTWLALNRVPSLSSSS